MSRPFRSQVSLSFLHQSCQCDQHNDLKSSLTLSVLVLYKVSSISVVMATCSICMDSYDEICEIVVPLQNGNA